MASLSLPSRPHWGKSAARLSGARGPPPSPGCGLRALVWMGPAYTVLQPPGFASIITTYGHMGHDVSKPLGQHRACGLGTTVLSPHDPHALTTSLTALYRRP